MRCGKIVIALLGTILATPVAAQITAYSSSADATEIASTVLPSVSTLPLYVRVIGGTVLSDAMSGVSTANGIYYQLSGTAEISIDGRMRTIHSSEGIFIPGGAKLVIKAADDQPAAYLHFLLSPVAYFDLSEVSGGIGRELYRSTSPIPGLRDGNYVLNLRKVTVPNQAPSDLPHHRSGAAVHCVLSGVGAETAKGITAVRGPGSITYEPSELVYQWSNPGNGPLTYLVFNLNPEAEDAVVASAVPGNQ